MWSHTIFMITSSVMLQFYIIIYHVARLMLQFYIIIYHVEVNFQDCIYRPVQYTMEAMSSKLKNDVM